MPLRLKSNSPEHPVDDPRIVLAETMLAICSPSRAAELVATALVYARLSEVPADTEGMLVFARLHLAPLLMGVLGLSAAQAVVNELEHILAGGRATSGTFRKV